MDAVDGDAARAVRGARLPERARVTRANAERLGTEQQFWCTRKCFVRDVLEAREIAIVDDASDGGEGVDDGRASELYEMRGRASEGEGDGTKASETKASFVARRVEVCGFVVEKRRRKDSKVIFTVDDGSGCVECVVWTQDGDAVSGEQMELFGIASTADGAAAVARDIRVGSLARVQGRIRDWNGRRQINATAVQVDLDPNEELLFWLDASLEI
jgi:hypothetical protein